MIIKQSATKEIFSIPYKDKYIIYVPLRQLAFLVTPDIINIVYKIFSNGDLSILSTNEKDKINPLIELGLFDRKITEPSFSGHEDFAPTYVTLLLTTRCNLRCIYCYASGGEKKEITLPFETAKCAIDLVIENAIFKKEKVFGVIFHGGGEPTVAWDTLKFSVEYAKEKAIKEGLKAKFNIATNGVVLRDQLDWIMENNMEVNLSIDGLEDIQNYHRPFSNGECSFNYVMDTIDRMNDMKYNFGIRTTVTDISVKYMDRIVEFFIHKCKAKRIHFEPVFSCGRCLTTGAHSPSPDDFIKGYRAAKQVAEKFGTSIYYSGSRVGTITTSFCRASGDSFCVTPEGYVTSCYEVCSLDDPRSDTFYYGKYDNKMKIFEFFEEKLTYLRKRTIENLPFCKDCFCKYHCAGDCIAKTSVNKDIMRIVNTSRCKINQALTLDQIINILN